MILRRNILIFHSAALGDFLMTWPLALALGRVFAQSRVMFVTASQKGALAEKAIGLEAHDADAGWHALHGDTLELPPMPTKLLAGLQLAVVFARERDEGFERRLRERAGDCAVIWINPTPPPGIHVMRHQLNELNAVPMLQQGVEQMQHLIETRGLQARTGDIRRVVIHPGSGAPRKNWPADSFAEVAASLKRQRYDVTITLGEVEREQWPSEVISRFSDIATVRSCDTLTDLYETIITAHAFIGNDSGPTHLAAMLGRQTIALFGPTSDPIAWRPVGPAVEVLTFDATPEQIVERLTR